MFMAIDPSATSGDTFAANIAMLVEAIHAQEGAHVPGDGRKSKRMSAQTGVPVNMETLAKFEAILC
jgi:(2R)-3-sulfolactate dehydrogenase (NADP+)